MFYREDIRFFNALYTQHLYDDKSHFHIEQPVGYWVIGAG